MNGDKKYSEYLKETIKDSRVCIYCKKTEGEIGNVLEGHASWCKWRRDMEEMAKADRTRKASADLEDSVRRHER